MSIVAQAILDNLVTNLSTFIEGEMCMQLGLKEEVKNLRNRLLRLRGFLQYAELKRYTEPHIATLAKELEDVMYDADNILGTCMMEDEQPTPLSVVRSVSFSLRSLKYRHEVGVDIINLNKRIDEIVKDNQIIATFACTGQSNGGSNHNKVPSAPQTSSIEDVTSVGPEIEAAAQKFISSIVKIDDDDDECHLFVITGMGGIGKTTLARRIFNDENITRIFPKPSHDRMSSNFSKMKIWLHVSKDYSETELLKEMIRDLGGEDKGEKTRAELEGKLVLLLPQSLFLVLDDVWSEEVWNELLRGPMNYKRTKCRVLVTTRHESIVNSLSASCTHRVKRMDNDTCWELLCKEVFKGKEKDKIPSFREIGHKIIQKCDGLPLAVMAIAKILRGKNKEPTEWDKVLKSEMWLMTRINDKVPGALYLSYEDLQPTMRRCFLYTSLLSANRPHMHMDDLVRYWIDEGSIITKQDRLMEDVAEDCYWELIERNLLQKCDHGYFGGQFCIMHDLLQSLGQFLMGEDEIRIRGEQRADMKSSLKLRWLLMSNTEEMLKVPESVTEPKHIRALFIHQCSLTKSIQDDLLNNLCNLRILELCGSKIEELPESMGDLFHLRHLDLDRTNIKEIPYSIGCLSNLQTLRAGSCAFLHRLPDTVTRLHKLRLLHIDGTPLSHVPKGIGKLKDLNTIKGLIIGHDNGDSSEHEEQGCDLDELQHLSNIRDLRLHKLHRSSAEKAASAFADKPFLRLLVLSEEPNMSDEKIPGTQKIYNDLTPPSSLQLLKIDNFPGHEFPRWMMSSSLGDSFPNLTTLDLSSATSCRELPPNLSQLPWLKYLYIRRADAITTIGPQFFACQPGAVAFPNLQAMVFEEMPNWKGWSSSGEVDLAGSKGSANVDMQLLPNLRMLSFYDCPKLEALPECLHLATKLKELFVERTELTKIDNFPILEKMTVIKCESLKELCNLPSLRRLIVAYCPKLELVDNLDALQHLSNDISDHHLPHWLSRLVLQPVFKKLELHCNLELLKNCLRGGPNWHVIHRIPIVRIVTYDHSTYLRYAMNPYFYKTNAQQE